ncbi:MAG: hypothetical protein P8X57_10170, partial [Cyclobacteriaceae bacterium]
DDWALRARWSALFRDWVRENVAKFEDREKMYKKFLELPDSRLERWDENNPPLKIWQGWIKGS